MVRIEISFGASTPCVLQANTVGEISTMVLNKVARPLANRCMPSRVSHKANSSYVSAICEFITNLTHGLEPKIEIIEFQNGSLILTGLDILDITDQRPQDWMEDQWWGHDLGSYIIQSYAGPDHYRFAVDGRLVRSQLELDPEHILGNVA